MCKTLQVLNWTKRNQNLNTKVIEQLEAGEIPAITDYYFWLGEGAEEFHDKTMEKINARRAKGVEQPDEQYKDALKEAIDSWGGVSGK